MFESIDEERLIRLMSRNEVLLFLGSGFSYNATNANGENFPIGPTLGRNIWNLLGYSGDYDNTALPEMYQAFINSSIKKEVKTQFLEGNLMSGNIPDIYNAIAKPFWYKIYTLNIDDILDKVFKRENRGIQILKYPKDDFEERDQSLDKTQIIHLNGKLPSEPNDVIFSTTQYAQASLVHQPLYGQFVSDYAVKTVIFVGTEINEPIFESYLEARQGRKRGIREHRPKSFLITPKLSPVKVDNYRTRYNVCMLWRC